MKKLIYASLALAAFTVSANARPVGYADSWMAMTENNGNTDNLQLMYSPSATYAVGYAAELWREADFQAHSVLFNYLINRWNMPKSQGNLYLKSNLGIALENGGNQSEPYAAAGIEADWEDRRFYTLYENRYVYAGDIDKFFMQKARVGIAPYEGDYGDVHTWLMVEVEHSPSARDEVTITPLVRMFYGNYLGEIGISDSGKALFNFTIQF